MLALPIPRGYYNNHNRAKHNSIDSNNNNSNNNNNNKSLNKCNTEMNIKMAEEEDKSRVPVNQYKNNYQHKCTLQDKTGQKLHVVADHNCCATPTKCYRANGW